MISHARLIRIQLCILSLVAIHVLPLSAQKMSEPATGIGVPQSMFFQPYTGRMWDVFSMVKHEGEYYMFYLLNRPMTPQWDSVGVATSTDGVTWRDRGIVIEKRDDATWLGTGWVYPYTGNDPDGPKWVMNYSQWYGPFPAKRGNVAKGEESHQLIAFARSDDLIHWKPYGEAKDFRPDPALYEPNRWDCIYPVPANEGGYHGFLSGHPTGEGYGFARAYTKDGLNWESRPPLKVEGFKGGVEIGAVEQLGGKWYINHRWGNAAYILIGDTLESVFRPQKNNFVFLERPGLFPRFFREGNGELLAVYHQAGRGIWFSPMKRVRLDSDGTLRLHWWPGNEAMKARALKGAPTAGDWNQGVVIEAVASLPKAGYAEKNFASGAKASASSSTQGNNASRVTDARADTYWSNANFFYSKGTENDRPEWLELDLGQSSPIGRIEIDFHTLSKAAKVAISVSDDQESWKQVAAIPPSDQDTNKVLTNVNARGRYVRFDFQERGAGPHGFMIGSVRIYQTPQLTMDSLAKLPGVRIPCEGEFDGLVFADAGGVVHFGRVNRNTGALFIERTFDRGIALSGKANFRLTGKSTEYDLYLNDHLINPWTLPGIPNGGAEPLRLEKVGMWSAVK